MALQLQTLTAIVSRTLGGEPDILTSTSIVGQAGNWLLAARRWKWAIRGPEGINLVASQDYAVLPAAFGSMVAMTRPYGYCIEEITDEQLTRLRASQLTMSGGSMGALVQWVQSSTSAEPAPRLALWPTPSANVTDGISIRYKIRWPSDLTPTAYTPTPWYVDPLLVEVTQAFAMGVDEPDAAGISARLGQIQRMPVWASAVQEDGSQAGGGSLPEVPPPGSSYWTLDRPISTIPRS